MNNDESKIIQQIKEGKFECFLNLYEKNFQDIYSFVQIMTKGNDNLIKNIVTNTFIVALEQITKFNEEKYLTFRVRLYKIAYELLNESLKYIEGDLNKGENKFYNDFFAKNEKLEQVLYYIEGFGLENKCLFVLKFWYSLSYEEIAVILGKRKESLNKKYEKIIGLTSNNFKYQLD